jgi:exopolysaccharide biosynthesis polyprenyl glycosylphosphotransferase
LDDIAPAGAPARRPRVERAAPPERLVSGPRWQRGYTTASVLMDLAAGLASATSAVVLRFGNGAPLLYIMWSLLLAPLWVAMIALNRAYEHRFIGVGAEEPRRVLHAGVATIALVSFSCYAAEAEVSRGFVLIAVPGMVALSLLARAFHRTWLRRQRAAGHCMQRTILVGSPEAVRRTVTRLHAETSHGLAVVGLCLTSGRRADTLDLPVSTFGDLRDVEAAVRKTSADVVTVLANARLTGEDMRRLAWRLESLGADLVVCSGLTEISGARVTIRPAAHSPMLQVEHPRMSGPSRVVKGCFDRTASLVGLLLIAPILIPIAFAIWAGDRKNPLFKQKRLGINGQPFGVYKFRTMVPDADRLRFSPDGSDLALAKGGRDPRVTPIGRILRKYSLDELPQLLNVLNGTMSLIGPRPQPAHEFDAFGADYRRKLAVKPGMTGLWQVSGRSDVSQAEREALDIRYVENWSLASDIVILFRTARAVVAAAGAY